MCCYVELFICCSVELFFSTAQWSYTFAAQASCVSVMTSILRQMSEGQYVLYIRSFDTPTDLMDFLMEILMTFEDLVKHCVYPPDWTEMILLQNWSVMLPSPSCIP